MRPIVSEAFRHSGGCSEKSTGQGRRRYLGSPLAFWGTLRGECRPWRDDGISEVLWHAGGPSEENTGYWKTMVSRKPFDNLGDPQRRIPPMGRRRYFGSLEALWHSGGHSDENTGHGETTVSRKPFDIFEDPQRKISAMGRRRYLGSCTAFLRAFRGKYRPE